MNKLIFMHIPKCGGTTVSKILRRIYSEERIFVIEAPDELSSNIDIFINRTNKQNIDLVTGHCSFGIQKHFDAKFITFLRNPVDRIISYYYFVKRIPNHRLHQLKIFKEGMSLLDFATEIKEADLNNGMIHFISGISSSGEEMLNKALYNIENHFAFVGTLEKFDKSLILLQKQNDWPPIFYSIKNKSPFYSKETDNTTLDVIRDLNKEDILLYNKIDENLKNQEIGLLDKVKFNSYNYYSNTKYKVKQKLPYVISRHIQ